MSSCILRNYSPWESSSRGCWDSFGSAQGRQPKSESAQSGTTGAAHSMADGTGTAMTTTVAIIGAGIGGISMALALKKRGFHDFVIYERDKDVGGTWLANRYPGCRSDVQGHWYCHSEHLNPYWSEAFPPQPEILAYWQSLAKSQDLLRHIQFGTSHVKSVWQPSSKTYAITLQSTSPGTKPFIVQHKILISSIGGFSKPLTPKIAGIDNWHGQAWHCATWPEGLGTENLRGKTVGVIGNACSGVQCVTALAEDPQINVISFGRTPQWYVKTRHPKDQKISRLWQWVFANVPLAMRLERFRIYAQHEFLWLLFVLSNGWFRKPIQKMTEKFLKDAAPTDMRDRVVPGYSIGAKRIVRDAGFMQALSKPNVKARAEEIIDCTEDSVILSSGEKLKIDALVYATGFDVLGSALDVQGRDRNTNDLLDKRLAMQAYHGITAPGFPNFFMLLGHNTAATHASVVFSIEVQANYIAQVVTDLKNKGVDVLEVKEDATKDYIAWVDRRAENTVWSTYHSWYREGTEFNGRIFTNWPAPVWRYWWQNASPDYSDYVGAESLVEDQAVIGGMGLTLWTLLVGIGLGILWGR